VVVEAALLFAAGMERICDKVLVLEATFEARLRRAEDRGWDLEELRRRDRRQLPLFEQPPAGYDPARILRVRNDADDNRLAERIAAALSR
jgi:dephospho-CoA kinase